MPKAHTTNIPNIKVQDQIGTAISAIIYGAGGDGLQNNTPRWTLRVLRGVTSHLEAVYKVIKIKVISF